jgi:MoaA/NifB/PqqE/SkfB family radical SAM enzyme
MMKQYALKLFLFLHIWKNNLYNLWRGRISPAGFWYLFQKQLVVMAVFRNAKYSRLGKRIFIDPFAPYFPSPFFLQVIDNNGVDTYPLKPNYAQISITNTCPCRCIHCHVQNTEEPDVPRETFVNLIREIANQDFPLLFFVGGEPFSRFENLVEYVREANKYMDTRVFTSGIGVTRARLQHLKKAGLKGLCVSLDGHEAALHNARRQHPEAFAAACFTIREAQKLGFYVSAVCCLTRSMIQSGDFSRVVDLAESLGAHSIQLNEIRPVGAAFQANDPDLFLTPDDKNILIEFYTRMNQGPRPMAISMPWYLEEPYNLGCTATSAQKVYVDARGNVQPCELLKISLGNITREPFSKIWQRFRKTCRFPVKDCIVWHYNSLIAKATNLPLDPEVTQRTWPAVYEIEQAECGKKIPVKEALNSPAYFQQTYSLNLRPHLDFIIKGRHWLPRKLGVPFVAFARTLYCRDAYTKTPAHEYLHLAQCHRWGLPRFAAHYLFHLVKNWLQTKNLGQAFAQVPFEIEARTYEECQRTAAQAPLQEGEP